MVLKECIYYHMAGTLNLFADELIDGTAYRVYQRSYHNIYLLLSYGRSNLDLLCSRNLLNQVLREIYEIVL